MNAYMNASFQGISMHNLAWYAWICMICAYFAHIFAHICAHMRGCLIFLADTDAYLADGYRKYARIFGMRGNPNLYIILACISSEE